MLNPALPASNIESFTLNVKGHYIHYLKSGKGRPVVLVHGGASSSRDWLKLMGENHGFTFYAPDLPGFGESARKEQGYFVTDFADFLTDFIDVLKLESPALVGHSLGARACLDAARQPGGSISKLILIDASGLGKSSAFGRFLFGFFAALRKVRGKAQPYPRLLVKEGVDWNYVGDEALKNIKIPTLLIWKNPDPYMPIANARRAQKLIPGAELAVVKGYGHAPHQQKDSREFTRLTLEFLNRSGDTLPATLRPGS
jgi:pimeloyl-ACP methyl ester carboxylesterase